MDKKNQNQNNITSKVIDLELDALPQETKTSNSSGFTTFPNTPTKDYSKVTDATVSAGVVSKILSNSGFNTQPMIGSSEINPSDTEDRSVPPPKQDPFIGNDLALLEDKTDSNGKDPASETEHKTQPIIGSSEIDPSDTDDKSAPLPKEVPFIGNDPAPLEEDNINGKLPPFGSGELPGFAKENSQNLESPLPGGGHQKQPIIGSGGTPAGSPPFSKPDGIVNGTSVDDLMDDKFIDPSDGDMITPNGDSINGGAGNDWIKAYGGNDIVNAGSGDDLVLLDDGNDQVFAESGNDTLDGGAGNDLLDGGAGADQMDGGDGNDIATYNSSSAGVTVSLNGERGAGGDAEGDRLINIERLVGSAFSDILAGSDVSNTINGGTGDDVIDGGAGADALFGEAGNDTVLGGDCKDTLSGFTGDDRLEGGNDDDVIAGEQGNDFLIGGSGNDRLIGDELIGAGDDTLYGVTGADILEGGAGDDLLFGEEDADTVFAGEGKDTVYGGTGNDSIFGDAGDDSIMAGAGADTAIGGEGDDSLSGNAGNDKLFGDAGDDVLSGGAGNDALFGFTGDDNISGGDGDDEIAGEAGADTLAGGAGNDVIFAGDGSDLVFAEDGNDVIRSGNANDSIFGGAGDDAIYSEADNDLIFGGSGNDYINAGDGDDSVSAEEGNDTVLGGDGDDLISGGAGNDALYGLGGKDTLDGGAGSDRLYGDIDGDSLLGGAGDDLVDASHGNDTLEGGAGNDTLAGGDNDDNVSGGEGNDMLYGDRQPNPNALPSSDAEILAKITYSPEYNSFGLLYQGDDYNVDAIKAAGHEMIIINAAKDADTSAPQSEQLWSEAEISSIKDSGKLVFGYVNLAKVNSTLKEWNPSWTDNGLANGNPTSSAPSWLSAAENSTTRLADFTDAGWQQIVLDRVGNMIDQGFQGTLLDDVLEYFSRGTEGLSGSALNEKIAQNAGAMRDFIIKIRDFADTKIAEKYGTAPAADHHFQLVVNGAPYLLQDALGVIDINAVLNNAQSQAYLNAINTVLIENYFARGDTQAIAYTTNLYGQNGVSIISVDTDQVTLQQREQIMTDAVNAGVLPYTTENAAYDTLNNPFLQDLREASVRTAGNDTLDGGAGSDVLNGGAGDDIFVIGKYKNTTDTIAHFTTSDTAEKMDLKAFNFTEFHQIKALMSQEGADVRITLPNNQFVILKNVPLSSLSANDFVGVSGRDGVVDGTDQDERIDLKQTNYIDAQGDAVTTGDNIIRADGGNDKIDGDAGNDTMTGGTGNDFFLIYAQPNTTDVITDFGANGDADKIDIVSVLALPAAPNFTKDILPMLSQEGTDVKITLPNNQFVILKNVQLSSLSANDFVGVVANDGIVIGTVGHDRIDNSYTDVDGDKVGAGNDLVVAQGGNDYVVTGEGNDYIDAGDGNDSISGQAGDDSILGGSGNDALVGDIGADHLDGGSGSDYLDGGAGNDYIQAGDGSATDSDILYGRDGNDILLGGKGNDNLFGDAGDDAIYTGIGNDTVLGGTGNDIFVIQKVAGTTTVIVDFATADGTEKIDLTAFGLVYFAKIKSLMTQDGMAVRIGLPEGQTLILQNVQISALSSDDFVNVVDSDGIVTGTGSNDRIDNSYTDVDGDQVGTGNDSVVAQGGNDYVMTGDGNDTIDAGDDNDSVSGQAGDDFILGGAGNDALVGDIGADRLDGGSGSDFLEGGAGNDYIEGGVGSATDRDTLYGGEGNDTQVGGSGNDNIFGGTGDDYINAGDGNDTVLGEAGNDALLGDAGADRLNGDAGSDYLDGGAGNDALMGETGNDSLNGGEGSDYLDGGAGNDSIQAGNGSATDGDILYGREGNDVLVGGTGNDNLFGDAGDDTIYTGVGNDTVVGGTGDDIFTITRQANTTTTITDFQVSGNAERINLSDFTNWLSTMSFRALLSQQGNDVQIRLQDNQFVILKNVQLDNLKLSDFIGHGQYTNNDVSGTDGNDRITLGYEDFDGTQVTNWGNNINGNGGDDTIDGGAGDDTMIGATGNDLFVIGVQAPRTVDIINDFDAYKFGDDQLDLTAFGFTNFAEILPLMKQVGRDVQIELNYGQQFVILKNVTLANLTGNDFAGMTAGNGTVTGTNANDLMTFGYTDADGDKITTGNDSINGGAGNDTIDASGGTDTITGGAGADRFVIGVQPYTTDVIKDFNPSQLGEQIDISAFGYTNIAQVRALLSQSGNNAIITLPEDQIVVLEGVQMGSLIHSNFVNIAPNDGIVTGTAGSDRIDAQFMDIDSDRVGAGNDTILGGAGNDTMDGGAGNDIMTGGAGEDVFVVTAKENTTDTITDFQTDGTAEKIYLSGFGFSQFNRDVRLLMSQQGADVQITLRNDQFVIIKNIQLSSLSADDFYGVSPNDGVVSGTAAGDNITLNTYTDVDGDKVSINADNINAGAGNDLIDGGAGNDTMTGGAGDDRFVIGVQASGTIDTITDFQTDGTAEKMDISAFGYSNFTQVKSRMTQVGDDVQIVLENSQFITLKNIQLNTLSADDFVNIAASDNIVTGTSGNDLIDTTYTDTDGDKVTAGNNVIVGGAGNDTINSGLGNDTMTGGAGADRFVVMAQRNTDKVITDFDTRHYGEQLDLTSLGINRMFHDVEVMTQIGSDVYIFTNDLQRVILKNVDINNLRNDHFMAEPSRDGFVKGTSGDDAINGLYVDGQDGDRIGGIAGDIIMSGSGRDTITATGNNVPNVFSFDAKDDFDTLIIGYDHFYNTQDKIQIIGANFSQLTISSYDASTATRIVTGTQITVTVDGDSDTIRLQGVNPSQINQSDFLF